MARQIFAAEINFQDTPLLVREKFADSEKNIKRLLQAFKKRVDEVFIFSNRQRFTVYIVHESLKPLTEFFHEEHALKGYVQYYYNSGESVTHLMATASGLLSAVKGESRILFELTKCYEWATSSACIGMTLDNALRKALDTGRSVRTQTGIDQFFASIVETGIELLYNRLQDIHKMNFVVIGTGNLAMVALDSLTGEGITNIAVTGHDAETARQMSKKYGIRFIELASLPDYFVHADVVIGAAHEELDKQLLPAIKEAGSGDSNSRVILDFGIPPNFDPETIGMLADEFYNLDDLRRLQPSALESFGGIEAAWRMVLKASNDFALLLHLLNHSPILNAYLSRQFAIKNAEWKLKPKRSIRSMLSFRKDDNISDATSVESKVNMRVQLNNHVAENAADVVREVQFVKRFSYLLFKN